jgi:hypothetical protein
MVEQIPFGIEVKLDKKVDVAIRAEVSSCYRPEDSKLPDLSLPAEIFHRF